jgi:hypothetical protein
MPDRYGRGRRGTRQEDRCHQGWRSCRGSSAG